MKIAELSVDLIAYTVFEAPAPNGGPSDEYLFEPDRDNALDLDMELYDGLALAEFAGRACYQAWSRSNPDTAHNAGYMLNILTKKHLSVLEHANVSFYVQGVSRSLTHELVRHRHFSPSQLSQRYVDSSDVRFVVPPALLGDKDSILDLAISCDTALDSYNEIVRRKMDAGLKRKQAREAARAVLPNATETKLVITGNLRCWLEFLIKRDNPAADAEIQRLAVVIGDHLAEHAANVFGPEARAAWDVREAQGEAREVGASA